MTAVLYEKRGKIAYVTINRPEAMNALNRDVQQGLTDAWQEIEADPDIFVAILTGTGGRAFSAGADLKTVETGEDSGDGGGQRRVPDSRSSRFQVTWAIGKGVIETRDSGYRRLLPRRRA